MSTPSLHTGRPHATALGAPRPWSILCPPEDVKLKNAVSMDWMRYVAALASDSAPLPGLRHLRGN
jgi:hypothetical protein